jgi:hypothetical protein
MPNTSPDRLLVRPRVEVGEVGRRELGEERIRDLAERRELHGERDLDVLERLGFDANLRQRGVDGGAELAVLGRKRSDTEQERNEQRSSHGCSGLVRNRRRAVTR